MTEDIAATPSTTEDPRDIDRARIREAFVEIAHSEIEDPDDIIGILDAALAASPYLATLDAAREDDRADYRKALAEKVRALPSTPGRSEFLRLIEDQLEGSET